MTDEKIKEAIEGWKVNILTVKDEERFADYVGWKDKDRSCVISFYAGFRAAERLAKIEALEEILDCSERGVTRAFVENKLDSLKAGQ